MHEFLILAALSRRPMHGYMVAKVIANIMGPFRQVGWGALYPILSRLEAEGLTEPAVGLEEGCGPTRKAYALTVKGRERLRGHVLDTERHLGEYDTLFSHKVALFSTLSAAERLHLSRHYAVYTQQNLDHLNQRRQDIIGAQHFAPDVKDDILTVMNHRHTYWSNELAWAEQLMSREQGKEAP